MKPGSPERRSVAGPRAAIALAAWLALAGCATYHPAPLASAANLAASPGRLTADTARMRVAPLKAIRIDPADGFTPLEIAVLAVLNDPDLLAKRKAAGVGEAQVFQAGLLPDPQIAASFDHPVGGPDTHNAFGVSPTLDVTGLLARSYAHHAAKFTARETDLNVLWSEWSAAQQARQLAETVLAAESRAAFLSRVLTLAAGRYGRSSQALERRDVSSQTTAADLAVKLDAENQLLTAQHDALKARRDLNALLGLRADVVLPLAPPAAAVGYRRPDIEQALATLADRRPDLLALKAGYAAQDVNVRKAVLAQFPLNNIGAAYAKDPAGTTTIGAALAFALPIFNGGRGEVRVQNATREQLRAEYQARLDATDAEVRAAEGERAAADSAAAALRADVPRLEALVQPALAAYDRGDIDSQTYLGLAQNALSRRADLDDKQLSARLAEIALETALFLPPAE